MKMFSCCVLVYGRFGETVVQSNESGLLRTDVSGSEFEVGTPTLEEEAEKKKSRSKALSKESSHGCFCELVAVYCTLQVFSYESLILVCVQVMLKRFREFSEMKKCRLAGRLMDS